MVKNIKNNKLKCWMNRAKNGAIYRACATPEKKKQPKKQVRNNPRPEGKRKVPYKVAYPERHRRQTTTQTTSKSTIAKDKKPKTEIKKKVVVAKPKSNFKPKEKPKEKPKPSKPKNEGALFKASLNKKVKDMTANEKKEYTRLRVKAHRDKKKGKPLPLTVKRADGSVSIIKMKEKKKEKKKTIIKPPPIKKKVVKKTMEEEGDEIIARLQKQFPQLKQAEEKRKLEKEKKAIEDKKKEEEEKEKAKQRREEGEKAKVEKKKPIKKEVVEYKNLPFQTTKNDFANKSKVVQYVMKNKKSIRDFAKKSIEEDPDTKKANSSTKGNFSFQKELIEEWFSTQSYYDELGEKETTLIEKGISSGKSEEYKELLQSISLIGSGIEFF